MNLKTILFGLVIIVIVLFISFGVSRVFFKENLFFKKQATANINNHVFKITIAKSAKEKEIGLSNKKNLAKNQGMLFPFNKEDYYGFWMKNMQFPIDIIYIKKGKIVTIFENVKPPKEVKGKLVVYQPSETSDTVLEINAGLVKEYKIKTGNEVKYENISN
ncbi:MAG TPA: DUF192 domain-containing protein [Patescibacteria group bacterium]|nr:DUF192 domain-containing protein [Patescibacteria group bacterium]